MARISKRWHALPTAGKVAIVLGSGLGLGAIVGLVVDVVRVRKHRIGAQTPDPYVELPSVLDYDEETDEPEPPGIQYADDAGPCEPPPAPWDVDVPVSMGLEGDEFCVPEADLEPKKKTDVVFATGGDRPLWPIDTTEKRKTTPSYEDVRGLWHGRWGRHFGAKRKSAKTGEQRVHVGVDIAADAGDVVVAMEDGEIIATLPFYKGLGAVYQKTDSGLIINYGEVKFGSWKSFGVPHGIELGHRVKAGDPIAKIGPADDGSVMLHLETYTPAATIEEIREGDMQWSAGDPPPSKVLDPTRYLVRAQRVHSEIA